MVMRVKLEIVPFGEEEAAREIARLDIFNMGHKLEGTYEYGIIEFDREKNIGGLHKHTVWHDRMNGPWELVKKALLLPLGFDK